MILHMCSKSITSKENKAKYVNKIFQKSKLILPMKSHHFMGNRWGNSGNSVRLYFWGLQNHCRW